MSSENWTTLEAVSLVLPTTLTAHPKHVKPKQGVEVDMTIWWVPSLWHSVTLPLRNPGYAPAYAFTYVTLVETYFSFSYVYASAYAYVKVWTSIIAKGYLAHYHQASLSMRNPVQNYTPKKFPKLGESEKLPREIDIWKFLHVGK